MSIMKKFRLPKSVNIQGRSSSITNAFVNGIVPSKKPSEAELKTALKILEMDEGNIRCAYCGDAYTEWDHLRPLVIDKKATGYITDIYNLVPSCGKCNQSKGNKDWKEWMTSDATLSPKTRKINDLDMRIIRLEKYSNWKEILPIDFEQIVGIEDWKTHWDNCNEIHELMAKSQEHSNKIKSKILSAYK